MKERDEERIGVEVEWVGDGVSDVEGRGIRRGVGKGHWKVEINEGWEKRGVGGWGVGRG